jgi:hypothetical protein
VTRGERAVCNDARRLYTRFVQPELEIHPEATIQRRLPVHQRTIKRREPPSEQGRLT